MTKRLIALILVFAMSLSFIAFADTPGTNEAIPGVYAYDFYFKDANGDILKTNTSGDITAETYAYLTDKDLSELDVTLSVFVYYKNRIIAGEKADAKITETASLIKTPKVTIDDAVKNDVSVKAILTTKDFSYLLAPAATLGSSNPDVEKIAIGEYEIFPEEDVYEYNIKRYFKAEEITPELRAYTSDLSVVKEITSVDDNGVIKYTLKTTSCDETESKEYKINVTPLLADDSLLTGIEIDGKTIKDFSPDKKEYNLAVSDDEIPFVTAYKFNSDAKVTVTDATKVPGTTEIKVSYNNTDTTYKINFVKPETVTLNADTGNPSYQYAYQYRDSATKVSAGLATSLQLKTGDANYTTNADRVAYAAFDMNTLGNVDIIWPINIKTTQRYTYYAVVDIYNSQYDDSVGIKDNFAEITNNTAKLVGSFTATTTNNVVPFGKDDIKICDNGNIVLLFTKKFGAHPQEDPAKLINLTSAVLEVTYLPKNLSVLTDEGFDTSLIKKPVKPEIIKGNASVTANSEWNDLNGFTLLKINLNAVFPEDCDDKNVLVKVLKPGINETDNKTLTEKYAYIYETKTNGDGEINESFNLSCDAGTYKIVLSCNGYEKSINTTLTMPSADKMNELLEGLKTDAYDKETLASYLTANLSGLSLTDSVFATFGEETRKTVSQYIIDNIGSYTAGGFSEVLKEGSILLGINEDESNDTVLKILETAEISELLKANENYEDYKNISKDELISLLKSGTYNSYDAVSDAVYDNLFIIYLKNCVDISEVTSVINRYRNCMSAECYIKYKGITDDDREIINSKILQMLNEIDTISKLEQIVISNLPDKIIVTEPSRTVYTYGFNFKNQSNTSVKEIGTASKIKAEAYAEISDPEGNDVNVKFAVMAYKGDKLIASNVMPYTLTDKAALISTGYVTVSADVTDVKAVLVSADEKEMLSTVATLGSENGEIEDIYIGNYKLPLEEGKYEYSLTRYFDESEPVKVRAYAKDFSAKIEITDEEEDGIKSYTVKSTSSDKNSKEEYKINLKAYSVNSTSLVGIELNGKEIAGFSPDVYEYYIGIKGSYVPDAAAYKFSDKAQVTVSKAEKVPGTTVITVVNGGNTQIYKINFVKILSTNIRHSDFRTMSGIHTYNTKYQVRASTEPMDGGTNIVLYYLFDLNSLGDIAVSNVWLTGTTLTENKLYFYNSTYSEMSEVEAPAAGNFREINDGLVTYLGENKFAKGETATVLLDKSNFEIKDNGKVVIVTRKRAGEINSTDYGEFQNGELKLEYIVKPTADAVISETGDGKFDISVLDKGELTYLSEKEGTLSLDTSWMGATPKLNLLLNADFLSESKNQNVYVKILKPGINEADDKALSEKYTYLNTFKLDEMGTLNEIITVDEASGDYKLIVKCENSEKVLTGTFTVPASDKITTLLNNLEDGAYTKDTLYDYLLENKSDLSLESSLINILKADTGKSVCDYLIKNLDVYTADGFNKMLSEALVVKGINNLESNQNIEKLLTEESIYSNLEADKNYKDYTSLADKNAFLNKVKAESFAKLSDVKEAFFKNLLIVKIKSVKSYLSVEGLIDSYSDYITASVYSKYNSLGYDKKTDVNIKIAANLSFITNISELETEIVKFIDTPNVIPPVPAGGGGGGGGGLGNVTSEAPEIIPPVTMNFTDVPSSFWGYSYIKNLFDKKIVSGKSEKEFCPNDYVTRAEFTKMLVSSINISGNAPASEFSDVSANDWYYSFVNLAVANGIIQGMSENTFEPNRSISRQDASVMINRILKLEQTKEEPFSDDLSIADYAKASVYALKENGIIQGFEGSFNPVSNLTRAEAAVIISNLIK